MTVTAYRSAYHHGDLHSALLAAARGLLEKEGLVGLTLRAAARAAGVSHAAPQHHFGDLAGLLSELAALGFQDLSDRLETARRETPPETRLQALGFAYVAYAHDHPAMFLLMFRSERLDRERPALRDAMRRAGELLGGVAVPPSPKDPSTPPRRSPTGSRLRAWSVVHGFAMLLIDGRLGPMLTETPGGDWRDLLADVMGIAPRG